MRKNKLFLWHTHSHTFADSHCGHVACILLLPVFANLPSCILQLIKSMNRHILQWCLQVNSRPAGTSRSLSSGHIRPAGDDTRCLLRRTVRVRARSGSQPPPPNLSLHHHKHLQTCKLTLASGLITERESAQIEVKLTLDVYFYLTAYIRIKLCVLSSVMRVKGE